MRSKICIKAKRRLLQTLASPLGQTPGSSDHQEVAGEDDGGGKAGEEEEEEPQKRMDGTDTQHRWTSPLRLEEKKDASLGGRSKKEEQLTRVSKF